MLLTSFISLALISSVFAFQFRLPLPILRRDLIGTAEDEADADFPGDKFFSFYSRPDIKAPKFKVTVWDEEALAPGYWFVAPYHELEQDIHAKHWVGPYIYDQKGEVIWSGGEDFQHFNVFDFKLSQFEGEQMLTLKFPYGSTGVIMDNTYTVRREVQFKKDGQYGRDMHEFNMIEDGSRALIVVSTEGRSTPQQARELGLSSNATCKSVWKGIQELDTVTSEPVFTWDARDHLSLTETTYLPAGNDYNKMCSHGWDILHFNAVDKFDDGDYLISARHTDTIYKIDRKTGEVVWRLGGKTSDFDFATKDVKFSRQHHATSRGNNGTHTFVAMFDNAIGSGSSHERPSHHNSRGLLLALNDETKVASIEAEYDHPRGGMTNSRGSFQTLPNGNAFMGWTYHTLLSEHAHDGRLLMEASLKLPGHCYRNYKFNWVGNPLQPPDVYAVAKNVEGSKDNVRTIAYVSWNGATEVAFWHLLRSDETGTATEVVASMPRTGFETALVFDGFAGYVVAEALDRHGVPIGRSDPIKTVAPSNRISEAVMENVQWLQDHVKQRISAVTNSVIKNPVLTFLAGIIFTLTAVMAVWIILRWRRTVFPWWYHRADENDSSEPLLQSSPREHLHTIYEDNEKLARIDDTD